MRTPSDSPASSRQPPAFQVIAERNNHRLEIGIKTTSARLSILDLARALAWASLEGQPGQPIFPYIAAH